MKTKKLPIKKSSKKPSRRIAPEPIWSTKTGEIIGNTDQLKSSTTGARRSRSFPPYPADAPQPGSAWLHWKGDIVQVRRVVRHSETKEPYVEYEHLGEDWIRSLAMWQDEARPGIKRFTLMGSGGPFTVGMRVHHSIFGIGTVKAFAKGRGNSGITSKGAITIAFDQHGPKELQPAFSDGKITRLPDQG